jgi:iron complex outermembrane receptor protein
MRRGLIAIVVLVVVAGVTSASADENEQPTAQDPAAEVAPAADESDAGTEVEPAPGTQSESGTQPEAATEPALNADDTIPDPAAGEYSAADIEEVVVWAQKREENLLEVPLAVSVIKSDLLESEYINQVGGLQRLVPSLTIVSDDVRIRGVGTGGFAVQVEPSVAFAIDGVVLGRTSQAFLNLVDVASVEVLRGPQGTLFGKNASAGLVQVLTRPPADELEATGEFLCYQDDEYILKGSVSGPLGERTGARVTGYYENDGGFTPNAAVGGNKNGEETYLIRTKLEHDLTDDINLLLNGFVQQRDLDGPELEFRSVTDPALRFIMDRLDVDPSPENDVSTSDGRSFTNSTDWGVWLDGDWTLPNEYVLTSLTAGLGFDTNGRDDVDEQPIPIRRPIFFSPTPTPFATVGPIDFQQSPNQGITQVSQELRLTSPEDRDFAYITGFYLQYLWLDDLLRRDFDACIAPAALAGIPVTVNPDLVPGQPCIDPTGSVTSLTDLSKTLGLPRIRGLPALTIAELARNLETQNYAVFAQGTYRLSDRFSVLGGIRLQYDTVEGGFDVTIGNPIPGFGFGEGPGDSGSIDGFGPSGKFAFQYFPNDAAMAYVSYARGYKGPTGTFEGSAFRKLDPETSNNYEIGFRSEILDTRGWVSLTGFWSDYQNFQEESFSDVEKAFVLSNVGEVRTRGVELESQVKPLDELTFYGSAAYIDATVQNFPDGPCYAPESSDPECVIRQNPPGTLPPTSATKNLAGADLPNSPDWKLYVMGRYERNLPDTALRGFFQMSYSWQDDTQFDLAQNPRTIQPAFGILDATIGLGTQDERVTASFFVENITGENYATAIFQDFVTGFSPNIIQFRPKEADRLFGFAVRVKF